MRAGNGPCASGRNSTPTSSSPSELKRTFSTGPFITRLELIGMIVGPAMTSAPNSTGGGCEFALRAKAHSPTARPRNRSAVASLVQPLFDNGVLIIHRVQIQVQAD